MDSPCGCAPSTRNPPGSERGANYIRTANSGRRALSLLYETRDRAAAGRPGAARVKRPLVRGARPCSRVHAAANERHGASRRHRAAVVLSKQDHAQRPGESPRAPGWTTRVIRYVTEESNTLSVGTERARERALAILLPLCPRGNRARHNPFTRWCPWRLSSSPRWCRGCSGTFGS